MRHTHSPDAIVQLRSPPRPIRCGCLAGWSCGIDGTDDGLVAALPALASLPTMTLALFCPETDSLGIPRRMPDIHDGDSHAVLDGPAHPRRDGHRPPRGDVRRSRGDGWPTPGLIGTSWAS